MSLKWKLFRVSNWVHLVLLIALFVFLIYEVIRDLGRSDIRAAFTVITSYGIYEAFIKVFLGKSRQETTGQALAVLFLVLLISGVYNLWFSVLLRRTIRRNHEQTFGSFLQPEQP